MCRLQLCHCGATYSRCHCCCVLPYHPSQIHGRSCLCSRTVVTCQALSYRSHASCPVVLVFCRAERYFCRAERYFCRTKGRNRGESISAIVSAISAGEKGQNLLKPDYNLNIDVKWTVQCTMLPITNGQYIILFVCSVQHVNYVDICILLN